MNNVLKNVLIGAAIGAGAGLCFDLCMKKVHKNKNPYEVIPDSDMRNSRLADVLESPNADIDSAEKGLSRLDSAYRSEWQGMGYPQTHNEIEQK